MKRFSGILECRFGSNEVMRTGDVHEVLPPEEEQGGAEDASKKRKIAVFASGNGSNFEALAEKFAGQISLLVCDRPGAYVIERAKKFGIKTLLLNPKDFASKAEYEVEIVRHLDGVGWIFLAGYMRLIGDTLLDAFPDRIVNIHPSLLPAYKGAHAIRDAFEAGETTYGVTIHYVNKELDGGEIIAQRAFEYTGRDLEELEKKVHAVEHELYPATVEKLIKSEI